MRILLLNDNPVVRKLVALSAQKTKDDLSVVWSVDEIEHQQYDLLIVDDANYSDEVMSALKEKIEYKSSLLMATRGAAVPAGFDKVINKPFLPTDLVELFVGIEKSLPSAAENEEISAPAEEENENILGSGYAVDDLDMLVDTDDESDTLNDYELEELSGEEVPLKTNVLDQDEVQELQDLLDDTDEIEDDFVLDDTVFESSMDELPDSLSMEDLDNDLLDLLDESKPSAEEEDDLADFMNEMDLEALMPEEDVQEENDDTLMEEIANEDETIEEDAFDALLDEPLDSPLSDDEFEDLEQQIQEAVGELGAEDLESTLDDMDFSDLDLEGLENELSAGDDFTSLDEMDELEGMDGLDSIDEREIKLAIGEELDEEPEIRVGSGEHLSLNIEALSEAMGKDMPAMAQEGERDAQIEQSEKTNTPAEGIETLQALLKALSNEDVAKTLKGLSINININFGNDK
ncbi:MAG TPA: hypothetical protein VFX68_05085 [Sulfuricurvum sp.]|nr:hypothetical protein [Sulfuricurvum sp.]